MSTPSDGSGASSKRDDAHPLMTPREVAAAARVEVNTVHRWAARGVLRAVRLGKLLRFRRDEVRAWLSGEERAS